MSMIGDWWQRGLSLLRRSADDQLQWRLTRQTQAAELRQAQALAEQELVAELQKRAQQLEHELALVATRHATELEMLKTRCQRDLKDYQDYLAALDKLKVSLRQSFTQLPEALAFTIHHHAKQLLNQLWEAEEWQTRVDAERQLLGLMTAVHEDSRLALLDTKETPTMPQQTLALLNSSEVLPLIKSAENSPRYP